MDTPTLGLCSSDSLPPLERVLTQEDDFIRTSEYLEVFAVQINKCDADEGRGDVYGSVEVVTMDGSHDLYCRQPENPEAIRVNGLITLTGPACGINLLTGFALNVDLHFRKEHASSISEGTGGDDVDEIKDVEICKWQLSWDIMKSEVAYIARGKYLVDVLEPPHPLRIENLCYTAEAGNDRPLSALLRGEDGCCSATVYYAILKHAVRAWVVVEILHLKYRRGNRPPPTKYNIHGTVFGRYGHFENDLEYSNNRVDIKDDYYKCTFFDTTDSEAVQGVCGERLALSRSVMAVPAYTSLVIEADLWYDDDDVHSHPKIAKGKVELKPLASGYFCDYIFGDNELAVRVVVDFSYWSNVPNSTPFY